MAMCFPASISGRMSFANAQNVLDDDSLHVDSHGYERSESERKNMGLGGQDQGYLRSGCRCVLAIKHE